MENPDTETNELQQSTDIVSYTCPACYGLVPQGKSQGSCCSDECEEFMENIFGDETQE
jgi:hypothetical protein